MMIVAGGTDRICYANWIKRSSLSLKIGSDRIYITAPSSSQYACRCVCIKMDAIGNHIEVSIDQIGCETGINLSKAKQNNFKEF